VFTTPQRNSSPFIRPAKVAIKIKKYSYLNLFPDLCQKEKNDADFFPHKKQILLAACKHPLHGNGAKFITENFLRHMQLE